MRLLSLRGRGIGTLRGTFDLDLSALSGLWAITGGNGAAKTTAVELWPASMFRKFPSRGKVAKLAKTRDAFAESKIDTGRGIWTITQLVDAVSGKGNTTVVDEEGKPVLSSAGVQEFDKWAATHLPTEEVFLGSQFTAQGALALLGMKPASRKGLVLRVLRIDRYERLAAACSKLAAEEEAKASALRATRRRSGVRPLEAIDQEIAASDRWLGSQAARIAQLEAEFAALRLKAEAARAASKDYAAAVEARAAAVEAHQKIATSLADVRKRLENNRALSADGPRIRAAVVEADKLKAEIATLQARAGDRERRRAADRSRYAELVRARDKASERSASTGQNVTDWKGELPLARRAAEVKAKLPELQEAVTRAEAIATIGRDRLDELQAKRVAGAEDRIVLLRGGLARIAADLDENESDASIASKTIQVDDETIRLSQTLPTATEQTKAALAKAREAVSFAASVYTRALSAAESKYSIESVEEQIAAALKAHDEAHAECRAAEIKRSTLEKETRTADEADSFDESRIPAAQAELDEALKVAAMRSRLDVAEERIAELAERETDLAETEAEALGKIPEIGAPPPAGCEAMVELSFAETELREAGEEEKRLRASSTRLAVERETAVKWWEADAEDTAKLSALEEEIADWSHLAGDFGRKGLQALEIDAAGPGLTATTNDLLRSCFGPRWCVSFETVLVNGDGDEKEGFAINVIDQKTGFEGDASEISGGEKVIVAEAVALAFTALDCARSGVVNPTLVRDETGAALEPAMAVAYVAMLRRAMELIGAGLMLFVSHSPAVQALADGRIEMKDGAIVGRS